jgi:hypothetical protein
MNITPDELTSPEPSKQDFVYNLVRGAVGMLPAGSLLAELFQWFVKSPLDRRSAKWCEEVGRILYNLQTERNVNLDELQQNEQFIDVVLQSCQIAIRHSQEEKRTALRNGIANTALMDTIDATRLQMFLDFRWCNVFSVF